MRRFIFIVLILLAAVVSGLVVRAKMASPFKAPVEDHGLSCRLSLPTAPPDKDHQIVCGLVVTNVSKGPIAVCTLNGRIGSQYPGRMEEEITPDFSKVHPTPQSLRASRQVLGPGESVELPFQLGYGGKDETFTLRVGYSVSQTFAREYNVWSGAIAAEREITITAEGVK